MFAPAAFSLLIRAAVVSFELHPHPGGIWWISRLSYYWVLMILLALLLVLIPVPMIIVGNGFYGADAIASAKGQKAVQLIWACLTLYVLYRAWPLLVAAFLVEGRDHYTSPWRRRLWYIREGAIWTGPGVFRALKWSVVPHVRTYFTVPVLLLLVAVPFMITVSDIVLASVPSIQFLVGLLVTVCGGMFLASMLTLCGWATLILAGETPSVISSQRIHLPLEELGEIQSEEESTRLFINRFPDDQTSYSTY